MAKAPTVLNEAVAFDRPAGTPGSGGVVSTVWSERWSSRAQFIYSRGSEVVEAARLEGRPIYKVRVRSCSAAREITTSWRMRDTRRGTEYSIREVDSVSDRQWVFLVVEGGKAP